MEKSISQSDLSAVEPYIRVETMVFASLQHLGINLDDAASHFAEVANKMRVCPPNCRLPFTSKKLDNVWVVRDYYPGTNFMFKATMVYHSAEYQADYHNKRHNDDLLAKDFDPKLWVSIKFIKPKFAKYKDRIYVPYERALKYAMVKSANILIDDDIKPESFMDLPGRTSRRMFPEGYKREDRPRKRSTHIHNKRASRRKDVPGDGSGTV